MAIKKFKDGSILATGDDMRAMLLSGHRYEKRCAYCAYDDIEDSEQCNECSGSDDTSCSCHSNPPCAKCVNNSFLLAENIIDYFYYSNGYKEKKSVKINIELYNKYKNYIDKVEINYEILTTTELAFCITKKSNDEELFIIIEPPGSLVSNAVKKIILQFLKQDWRYL